MIYKKKEEQFFDANGDLFNAEIQSKIKDRTHEGVYNNLFLLSDGSLLKEYKRDKDEFGLKPISCRMFDTLAEIDSPHLVKLKDRLYICDHVKDCEDLKSNPENYTISAYTREYILQQKIQILKTRKEYLLHNIAGLQQLADSLSKKGIEISFRLSEFYRIGPNGIVIINPDYFRVNIIKNNTSFASLSYRNKEKVLSIVRSIIISQVSNKFLSLSDSFYDGIYDFLDLSIAGCQDMALEVEKRLSGYNRPIDYVKRCR